MNCCCLGFSTSPDCPSHGQPIRKRYEEQIKRLEAMNKLLTEKLVMMDMVTPKTYVLDAGLEAQFKEAMDLLNEAGPIMENHYLRKSWFDRVNRLKAR